MPVGYGKRLREAVKESKKRAHARYTCPSCSRSAVKRQSHGVWECRKCHSVFASGAYQFGR